MWWLFRKLRKITWFLLGLVIFTNYSSCMPQKLLPISYLKEHDAPQWVTDTSMVLEMPHELLWFLSNTSQNVWHFVQTADKNAQMRKGMQQEHGE